MNLIATRYRTASGSDRMLALNQRYLGSFASVESMIRSLPLAVLYRVVASTAIKSSPYSFTGLKETGVKTLSLCSDCPNGAADLQPRVAASATLGKEND